MDTSAADHLESLLGLFDGPDVARTRRLLEQARERDQDTDVVVVAVVGPSGVGKSTLVNTWAGAPVADVGALRPTTREPLVVGDPATPRLNGFRRTRLDGGRPLGVVLVDTPPWEHAPAVVDAVLDVTDVALLVLSPSRYADAVARAAAEHVEARGIALELVFNRIPPNGERIVAAAAELAARDIPVALAEAPEGDLPDAEGLFELLGRFDRDRFDLLRSRRAAALPDIAAAVEPLAVEADERRRDEAAFAEVARRCIGEVSIPMRDLAPAAAMAWPRASAHLASAVDAAVAAAVDELSNSAEPRGVAAGRTDGSLRPVDPELFDPWKAAVTDAAVETIRPRWLRRFRRKAVADEVWRLDLDADRVPPRRVRRYLSDRLPALRTSGGAAMGPFVSTAVASASSRLLAALGKPSIVPGDTLRDAAATLTDGLGGGSTHAATRAGVDADG